jgi:hypothetical protein
MKKLLLPIMAAGVPAGCGTPKPAVDTVAAPWSPDLERVYRTLGGILQMKLDLDKIKRTRPEMGALLRKHGG